MRDMPAIIIGMAGAALLLGSLAPAAIEARNSDQAGLAKGDRLAAARPSAGERVSVPTDEMVDQSRGAVVFKGRDGAVLVRSHPAAATTVIVKNVDVPIVGLKEEPIRPAVERSREGREGSHPPRKERRPQTVGCETALSVLVRHEASRVPRLCLAQAPMPARS